MRNVKIASFLVLLIRGLIEWKKRDFKEKGGIKEEMYKARKDWQRRNGGSNG